MKNFFLFPIVLILAGTSVASVSAQEKVKKVRIKAVEGLRFEPARFSAKRGEKLELSLENHDPNDQPHNFVLIKPGSLAEIQAASMAVDANSAAEGFVPKSDAILAKTGLLNPEQKEVITLELPKEKGIYPFVCTFPGHALVMYGALYVDTKITEDLAFDPNVPEMIRALELEKLKAKLAVERPTFQRLFMPDAGPAAIAVALPGDLNFCWDAGNCRLRYAWTGGFVDATRMWNSNGNALGKILGERFWNSVEGERIFGVQIGEAPAEAVNFVGYDVIGGVPKFEYEVDGTAVTELITATPDGDLKWAFTIDAPDGDVRILAPESERATVSATVGERQGDFWRVPQKDATEFSFSLKLK